MDSLDHPTKAVGHHGNLSLFSWLFLLSERHRMDLAFQLPIIKLVTIITGVLYVCKRHTSMLGRSRYRQSRLDRIAITHLVWYHTAFNATTTSSPIIVGWSAVMEIKVKGNKKKRCGWRTHCSLEGRKRRGVAWILHVHSSCWSDHPVIVIEGIDSQWTMNSYLPSRNLPLTFVTLNPSSNV